MVILIIVFIIALLFSSIFRWLVIHPTNIFRTCINGPIDLYKHFHYRLYNRVPLGLIRGYCGTFGNGKTLSMTHDMRLLYRKYNNKKWYDENKHKWVTNKMYILTNVELTDVPFRELVSLDQVGIWCSEQRKEYDNDNDICSVLIIGIDECSVQASARNFKTNFNADFVRSLMECRHHNVAMLCYSAPRFKHVDAMLRQVTTEIYSCTKKWRFQKMLHFDAQLLEESDDLSLVRPDKKRMWFVRNSDYKAYDTMSCVANFIDTYKNDGFISEMEKLSLQQNDVNHVDPISISHPSRKLRKNMKRYA